MRYTILTIALLSLPSLTAHANQAPMNSQPQPQMQTQSQTPQTNSLQTNNSSFAVTLARQAGLIAGAAQACNQDVSLLSARLDEAISVVAQNPVDSSDAIAAYQQSLKEAFKKQSAEHSIPCEVVVVDYQQIPLLRDDYKEVVLSALKADQTPHVNPAAMPQTTQQPQPTTAIPQPTQGQPNKKTP